MKWIGVLGLVAVFLCPAWAGYIPLKERRTNETVRPIPRQNVCLTQGYYILNPGDTICLSSPGYPNNYPNNANDFLLIDNTDSLGQLYVECEELSIQNSDECNKDNLIIYDFSDVSRIYCGDDKPSTFTTTSYLLDFYFSSDSSINAKGFKCYVTALAPGAKPPVSDCECGLVNSVSRIVNGSHSDQNEYPWLVGLSYNFDNYIKPWCGGSVYNNEWIITAAHCVDMEFLLSNPAYVKVVLGMYNYVTSSPTPTTRTVDNIVVHPDYNNGIALNNDIALLHMVTPVEYNHAIRPVCMPDVSADYTGQMATVTGWGVLNFGEAPRPDMAHEVQVLIRTVAECQESYGAGVNENMICAGTDTFDKDACQGDSGGPLTVPVGGRHFLAGVVSWGAGCALSPYYGVYTDVPNYVIDFIQKNAGTACTP